MRAEMAIDFKSTACGSGTKRICLAAAKRADFRRDQTNTPLREFSAFSQQLRQFFSVAATCSKPDDDVCLFANGLP